MVYPAFRKAGAGINVHFWVPRRSSSKATAPRLPFSTQFYLLRSLRAPRQPLPALL